MPATFVNFLSCSLGGSEFQLEDWAYRVEPILKEGLRTGTKHTVEGEGWVEASSESTLASRMATAIASFIISGQNFIVYGLGGVKVLEILSAACSDGGPHITVEILKQKPGAALKKDFRFVLTADQGGDSTDPSKVTNTYKVKTITRPDGLKVMTASGELVGKGTRAYFDATVVPFFNGLAPVPNVPVVEFDANAAGDKASYRLEYSQLAAQLPIVAGATIVDGDLTTSTERDDQMRKLTTYAFDFLITGDPMKVRDQIRASLPTTPIRERFETTFHKEVRVRGEFQVLSDADGNFLKDGQGLLNWEQELEVERGEEFPIEVETSPVLDPLLYQAEKVPTQVLQRGSAIGLGKFVKEPPMLFPGDIAQRPRITYKTISTFEYQTSWEYRFTFRSPPSIDGALLAKLARPAAPEFK